MDRFKEGEFFADISAGEEPKATHQVRGDIRENVPEQVRGDDHVILAGVEEDIEAERIDVAFPDRNSGLLCLIDTDITEEHIRCENVRLMPDGQGVALGSKHAGIP